MEQKRRKRKSKCGRGKEKRKRKVLKRGSVRNDCESVGDNFQYSFKPETIQKMNRFLYNFVWTDERAKLLIDTYSNYLEHDAIELQDYDIRERERCLEKLKTVFNEVPADDIHPNAKAYVRLHRERKVTGDAITSTLDNRFATTYFENQIACGQLKLIFKEKWSQFKLLVQHEKFEYYRPLDAPPLDRCKTGLKGRSSNSSTATVFYWTDELLQHLVQSYSLVLRSIKVGTLKPKRTDCLNHLKRSFGGVSFDVLNSRLNAIFTNESVEHEMALQFRKRLGKENCIIFEEILEDAHRDVYKKETWSRTSSSSRNTSSSIRSPSPYKLAADAKKAESDKVMEAVRNLGFKGPDFALAMCELTDERLQHMFWGCQGDERKTFVEQCIKNQKWRSSQ